MKDYSFGNYICALRTGLGYSQFQLGNLVGVTDKAVSKWENGDAKPRLATCYRLADVLGVSVNELLSCEQFITLSARKELDKMNKQLWLAAYEKLSLYGAYPPAICWSRLAAEEAALQGTDAIQGYAVLGKIKREALARHTAIIVCGTVGSSFAAWLLGGTEVNPLPPHYICPKCGKAEFVQNVRDGFDLPPKQCDCGGEYLRDGHSIPFEGYAKAERSGTNIELRVSDTFKPIAVQILLDFYKGVAEVLPVMVQSEDNGWCVERYVVLPKQKAKPKVSEDGFWYVDSDEYWQWQENETTFNFIIGKQLNALEKLRDSTGINPPNPQLCLTPQMAEALYRRRCERQAFITEQLSDVIPDFDLLLRVDLLSHATGAWDGNGAQLLREGEANFRDIPAAREDIFNAIDMRLAQNGIRDSGLALLVMEKARKGLFYSQGMDSDVEKMVLTLGLPGWYPDYLKKIMYLFPKAHSVAYLLVDILLQWYLERDPGICAAGVK